MRAARALDQGRACGAARGALLQRLMDRALRAVEARAEAQGAEIEERGRTLAVAAQPGDHKWDQQRSQLGEALARAAADRDALLDAKRQEARLRQREAGAAARAAHADNEAAALRQGAISPDLPLTSP